MVRIFISYSRVDLQFTKQLYEHLQQMRPSWYIWYDQAPDGLLGGDRWWDEILSAIAQSDIFIYVLSNESVQSKYCQAEFEEARRLQKRIITIQARDRTKITGNLADIQFIDMKNGIDNDGVAVAKLSGALDRQASRIKKQRPLWRLQTPKPADEPAPAPRPDDAPDIDTPMIHIPHATPQNITPKPKPAPTPTGKSSSWLLGVLGVLVMGVFVIFQNMNKDDPKLDSPTAVVSVPTETPTATETETPLESPTLTPTPEPTLTPSQEPTPDLIAAAELIVKQMTAQAIIDAETATAFLKTQEYELQLTESANLTATATRWTHTPTPNITASVEAILTGWAQETAIKDSINSTATATHWTATPTNTNTPTATLTPTPTFTPTPNATQTLIAYRPLTNPDWTPVEREFDGVMMVLVPAGCFMMGSTRYDDEQPVHEQCFDEPFWIDKTEVPQAQFTSLGGVKAENNRFSGDNRPVDRITWFEARDFCALRGGRLPTEAEWEYTAGGVESWIYPWGNEWDADNAIYSGNSNNQTTVVGSRPHGASWVGALDMSGNVWEWTSSLYEVYPYDGDDGRERDTGNSTDVRRVLRGGFFNYINSHNLRVADRGRSNPSSRSDDYGFRCARDY